MRATRFICESCRDGDHDACHRGTWCDCQHRSRRTLHALLVVAALGMIACGCVGGPYSTSGPPAMLRITHTR